MICKGIITDLVGQPIPKAIITIKSIRGATAITSSVYFHQCNDKGEYNFSLLEGKYKIWIQNSNFSDKNLVGVGVVESDTPDGDIDSILVAEDVPTPDKPIEPTTSDVTYTERTFIPIYVYFKPDDIIGDITDKEVTDLLKNTEVHIRLEHQRGSQENIDSSSKTLPLIYLDKTDEGFKYVVPYPIALVPGMYMMRYTITIKLIDFTGYPYGITSSVSTQIFKGHTYSEEMNVFKPTNKLSILLAKTTDTVNDPHLGIDELRKEHYFLTNLETNYEDTFATFKFLETAVPVSFKELIDKDPASVLVPYTIKVRFTNDSWVDDAPSDTFEGNPKFGVYVMNSETGNGTWIEASHIENGVVWYTFPEEMIEDKYYTAIFTRSDPNEELSWDSKWNQTRDISLTINSYYSELIQGEAHNITKTEPNYIYVNAAYM